VRVTSISGSPNADQGRKDVALLQKHPAGDADRFLSAADIDAAADQTAAIQTRQFVFQSAGEQDPAKRLDESFVWRSLRRF